MNNLLKDSYDRAEQIKGKQLLYLLLSLFVVFIILGISIGYLFNESLKPREKAEINMEEQVIVKPNEYRGRVRAVSEADYPGENISYGLFDDSGLVILLKTSPDDLRLEVSNGLPVSVTGNMSKTRDGTQDVLLVDEVVYINESN